jgi:hypothetical protein
LMMLVTLMVVTLMVVALMRMVVIVGELMFQGGSARVLRIIQNFSCAQLIYLPVNFFVFESGSPRKKCSRLNQPRAEIKHVCDSADGGTSLYGMSLWGQGQTDGAVNNSSGNYLGTLLFSVLGQANVLYEARMAGATLTEVLPSVVEAEVAIHRQTNLRGIVILLAVILPPADRAELHGRWRAQCTRTAAGAAVTHGRRRRGLYKLLIHVCSCLGCFCLDCS